MQIVYEGATFEIQPGGVASRYFAGLIARLPPSIRPIVMVPDDFTFPAFHPRLRLEQVRTKAPPRPFRGTWRKRQHGIVQRQIDAFSPDLVHWTHHTGLCRRPFQRSGVPTVVTVYDFIAERFPEQDPDGSNRRWQRQAIESADHLCCISQTTYHELCRRYPQAASRASVTNLGNSFAAVKPAPIKNDRIDAPYLLFVGRREGYKNFLTLYRAWRRARSKVSDLSLVLAGPPLKRRERLELGMTQEADGLVDLGQVSDRQLKGLYQNCAAFVCPSRMEGFGLRALEAMASGATVVASNCEALREVVGDAGYYFDPDDVDYLTDQLVAVADDRLSDRHWKVQQGLARSKKFSWQRTAEQTAQVYARLLDRESMPRAA